MRPDDSKPATKGDVRKAYRRNRRRTLVLLGLMLVVVGCFFAYTNHQQSVAAATVHRNCEQRHAAVVKANTFYARMAVLEESNRFIGQKLRDQRVAAYRGQVYALPHC